MKVVFFYLNKPYFMVIYTVHVCYRSIPQEQLDEINSVLERDFMIRAIHDVKGIDIGSNLIRYKVNPAL